jgi:serine/threonine protein kinase
MLEKGIILSGYRVDGVIGQGGMGVVYEATQLSLSRTVALKVLAESLSSDDLFRERFRREGMVQAAIDHAHIVTVYDTGESPYGLYLAMRLVRGGNLKDAILAQQLDAHRAVQLLSQVANALDAAHQAGLVHRDVKPQNILIGPGDHAYLADFGLTKALGTRGVTRTGDFIGSVDYMSPEQIRGQSPSYPSDIYAFAAVLYEALTGAVPYPKDTDAAVIFAQVEEDPPSVTAVRPELPAELDAVIERAMAKDPNERPTSAAELIRDAERALGPLRDELEAPVPVEAPPPAVRRSPVAKSATPVKKDDDSAVTEDPDTEPLGESPPSAKRARQPTVKRRRARPTRARRRAAPTRAASRPATRVSAEPSPATRTPFGRRRVAALVLAAAAVAGVAAGVALGVSGGSDSGPSERPSGVVSAGGLNLRHPGDWAPTEAPSILGLSLRTPIALAPSGDATDVGLVAGYTDASGPTLLPPPFVELVGGDLQGRERVLMNGLQGYRYSDLEHEDMGDRVNLYVTPTTLGAATIACFARAGNTSLAACEGIAGTLRLTRGRAYALGPAPAYARSLSATLTTLARRRSLGIRRVRSASSVAAVARHLRSIARVYATSARRLGRRTLSPELEPTNRAIVAATARTGREYEGLARAAASGSNARYAAGQRRVQSAERSLNAAVSRLGSLGYSVG